VTIKSQEEKLFVIVTSISAPNEVLKALADGCQEYHHQFIVIGDVKSPEEFQLPGCDFYNIRDQHKLEFKFVQICPENHYARKNIGYLLAIKSGATVIVDTDDDNIPYASFWEKRHKTQEVSVVEKAGWLNVYRYFSNSNIWPRGYPLNQIIRDVPVEASLPVRLLSCPIQQGLANKNPDVDAIYRLTSSLPQDFLNRSSIALAHQSWCPFNSQNTTWWKEAFFLLYLPSFCSFRMTDIWRSFVAQRISWQYDWPILFHESTVWQERNEHDLMRDFEDEIPGYLYNEKIGDELEGLTLRRGHENISDNLKICYEKLVEMNLVDAKELQLLDAWIADLKSL